MKQHLFKLKLLLIILSFHLANAQNLIKSDSLIPQKIEKSKFNYPSLIAPTVLMTYGIVGLDTHSLKRLDVNIRNEVVGNNYKKTKVDNFTAVAPAVAVYALNFAGVKGKNNFKDRSIVIATSYALTGGSTIAIKNITKRERPDGSTADSFPSGHTAFAFAGAEFMWQEYKDVSVWYGISGYVVAAGTGVFRMYNNRHWLTDVAMGAGIGILSTKVAYWLLPVINDKIFNTKNKNVSYIVMPFYQDKKAGLGFVMHL